MVTRDEILQLVNKFGRESEWVGYYSDGSDSQHDARDKTDVAWRALVAAIDSLLADAAKWEAVKYVVRDVPVGRLRLIAERLVTDNWPFAADIVCAIADALEKEQADAPLHQPS